MAVGIERDKGEAEIHFRRGLRNRNATLGAVDVGGHQRPRVRDLEHDLAAHGSNWRLDVGLQPKTELGAIIDWQIREGRQPVERRFALQ